MSKLVFAAVATVIFGAAGARAQTWRQPASPEAYSALAPGRDAGLLSESAPTDQKVMGLSVPNGSKAPGYGGVRSY